MEKAMKAEMARAMSWKAGLQKMALMGLLVYYKHSIKENTME
jgi:hypothetical protein